VYEFIALYAYAGSTCYSCFVDLQLENTPSSAPSWISYDRFQLLHTTGCLHHNFASAITLKDIASVYVYPKPNAFWFDFICQEGIGIHLYNIFCDTLFLVLTVCQFSVALSFPAATQGSRHDSSP